jgi:Uma2 family endonuclease
LVDAESLAAVLEPLDVLADRLFRVPAEVYRGMVDHGLLAEGDGVEFVDGLLIEGNGQGGDRADRLYRMPLEVYDRIADLGLLGPRDKVELLDGLLVKKMTKGLPHFVATYLIREALDGVIPDGWFVAKEDPVALPAGPAGRDSEPEPDVTVIRGGIRDYLARRPGPADVALVVEVAESSLREDRAKLTRYAWQSIPVAWIVNLVDGVIEVYSGPTGPAKPAEYRDRTTYGPDDNIPGVLDGREAGRIAVRALLP